MARMMARWIAPYCCDLRVLVRLAGLAVPLLIWEVASRAGCFTPYSPRRSPRRR